ncbi:beta-1,4-N-acetylgalactosaminyltransferase bre-4-like [Rhipicephalus sanguineus]|uniref:beta-1,4-N-acetylgalactosaminyltransferase bre-4-like n=1 Tax=Rhipicephalus sanguineus TaxID=34632 RepID=UPI0020C33AE9|nr:beta-1,4-N-acetylgalactosaminyltransferase bre-4-like [Rhipicephalus sanguineus]
MTASKGAAGHAGVRTLVCMVLVVVVNLLFNEQKLVDTGIGNAGPFEYTAATRRNLSDRTRSRRQRRAPRNFCSVNWTRGTLLVVGDLLHVKKEGPPLSVLEKTMPHVMPGGRWFPTGCTARYRVAIVVPYRDRLNNLQAFLQHMHPFLQSQQLDYGIYVVEQNDTEGFKRAKLFNAGYEIVKAMHNHSCFIFHDVDLLPENRRNIYACKKEGGFHLPTCIDTWKYTIMYPGIFGGVCAMSTKHMEKVNGFSNLYSRWGCEDDDMARRFRLLRRSFFRNFKDGLNSLKYTVLDIVFKKLYTHITLDTSDSGPRRERNSTGD